MRADVGQVEANTDPDRHAEALLELRAERRSDAYAAWTVRTQKAAESRMVCERDRLPELGVVALSAFMPFLSLHEPSATTERLSASG